MKKIKWGSVIVLLFTLLILAGCIGIAVWQRDAILAKGQEFTQEEDKAAYLKGLLSGRKDTDTNPTPVKVKVLSAKKTGVPGVKQAQTPAKPQVAAAATLTSMPIPTGEPIVSEGISWFSTPTPGSIGEAVVSVESLNLRDGPGTDYAKVGSVNQRDKLEILGKNLPGTWLKITAPGGAKAWVYAELVTMDTPADDVPIVSVPPTPMPVK